MYLQLSKDIYVCKYLRKTLIGWAHPREEPALERVVASYHRSLLIFMSALPPGFLAQTLRLESVNR
jgi:hypothetical protein